MASSANSTPAPSSGGPVTQAIAAMRVEPKPPRRGFLAGLLGLPLIGGGLALIGAPTATAEPVTRQLLDSYDAWLLHERCRLKAERIGPEFYWEGLSDRNEALSVALNAIPLNNGGERFHLGFAPNTAPPSTRAALVLSAVGADWR